MFYYCALKIIASAHTCLHVSTSSPLANSGQNVKGPKKVIARPHSTEPALLAKRNHSVQSSMTPLLCESEKLQRKC